MSRIPIGVLCLCRTVQYRSKQGKVGVFLGSHILLQNFNDWIRHGSNLVGQAHAVCKLKDVKNETAKQYLIRNCNTFMIFKHDELLKIHFPK